MPGSQLSAVVQQLRRGALLRDGAALTDGQLLECFLEHREAAAIDALVRRHASMVWGVCRRVLRNYHDAEDAFQATFLVLVRRAASVVPREQVANWLYGVAHQTALKARATAARRKARERQVVQTPEPAVTEADFEHHLLPVLDQELSRLPNKYRVLLVLCDLEGKTRKEVARQLAVPEGTVAGRLSRARDMLAKRLERHRLIVSGALLGVILKQNAAATACVPTAAVTSTVKAATLVAAGHALAAGTVTAEVAALTNGVLNSLLLGKLKAAAFVSLAVAVFVLGAGAVGFGALAVRGAPAGPKPPPPKKLVAQGPKKPDAPEPNKPAPAPELPKNDEAAIQGMWITTAAEMGGEKLKMTSKWLIGEKNIVHKSDDGAVLGEWTYSLIPTKTPKFIYLTASAGPTKGGTHFAIYELDGDSLKLCYDAIGKKRPTGFETNPADPECRLFVLKRAAP